MTQDARKIRLIMELRQQGISDTKVLSAIERVPREIFVSPSFVDQAYENTALPIEEGQTISQPYVVAFMTQALDVHPRQRVLEIGTGSGYQAAVLAKLCRRVFTVERYRSLLRRAEEKFKRARINNIVARLGDGALGWPELAPFDRIIVTAAAPEVPSALKEQLSDKGGILIVPVGRDSQAQQIVRIVRNGEAFTSEELLPVRFVPLVAGVVRDNNSVTAR
ncbi:MAG: protein-L-isoaspartate(D-aspartate) O-methyltransferase [Alphaproteobacteria bacterium]